MRFQVEPHQFTREDLAAGGIDDQRIEADVQVADAVVEQGQAELEQRPAAGVQHLVGQALAIALQRLLRSLFVHAAQVDAGHAIRRYLFQDLLAAIAEEYCPQHVMALDHAVQRVLEARHIEVANAQLLVAVGADAAEADRRLATEPVGLLDIGQGERLVTVERIRRNHAEGRFTLDLLVAAGTDRIDQFTRRRRFEQAAQGQLRSHPLIDRIHQPRSQQ